MVKDDLASVYLLFNSTKLKISLTYLIISHETNLIVANVENSMNLILLLLWIIQSLELEGCVNATTPKVATVLRGASASIYVDNAAYRSFIHNQFMVSPVEMESAGVALICHQQLVPFITIRALSDLAGGGSAESNEADTFITVAATNSVIALVQFIKELSLSIASFLFNWDYICCFYLLFVTCYMCTVRVE